jgi:acyl-CoA thioester hydrolase
MEDARTKYPVRVDQSLQWGDMDAFNHVNNTVYFRFFENARLRLMESAAIMEIMEREQIGPILAWIEGNFRIPLTYPDTVSTCIRVKSIGRTSFVVEQMVWSQRHQAIACIGDGVVVHVDYATGKKVAIPDEMRTRLEEYM